MTQKQDSKPIGMQWIRSAETSPRLACKKLYFITHVNGRSHRNFKYSPWGILLLHK
jgi:hypothetical protein